MKPIKQLLALTRLLCLFYTAALPQTGMAEGTQPAGAGGGMHEFPSLEAEIGAIFAAGDLAGLSAGIIKDGKLVWTTTRGMKDLAKKLPVNIDTIFTLGSLSKTVTGAALMHLYDKGLLQLDDDINQYLPFEIRNPQYPEEPITIRMVLTHTSSLLDNSEYVSSLYGCGDQTGLSFGDYLENTYVTGGSHYETGNFGDYRPGKSWHYTNSNYVLIAYLVERISKQTFPAYCHENLFEPLGMRDTAWLLSGAVVDNLARQYIAESEALKYPNHPRLDKTATDGKTGVCHYSWPGYPDGNLKTSVPQFANFMSMLMNGGALAGQQILKPTTVDLILAPQSVSNMVTSERWKRIDQGLTWQIRESDTEYWYSHGGGGAGISTFAFFNPRDNSGGLFFLTGDWHDKQYDRQVFDALRKHMEQLQ